MACGIPMIIGSLEWVGAIGNIASTVLASPPANGLYRVSIGGIDTGGYASGIKCTFTYADDSGPRTFSLDVDSQQFMQSFRAVTGTDIAVSVVPDNTYSAPWSGNVVLEKL
jgi:hypothetical protein